MTDEIDDARRRAERRAFIRDAHPDAGGDPERFIAGLARLDAERSHDRAAGTDPTDHRLQVYRSRRLDRVVLRTLRDWRRRAAGKPTRRLR